MVARHGKMNTFMVAAFAIAASAIAAAANATKTLTLPVGATMELIYVSPGAFTMGSPSSEAGRFDDETQHQVTLTKGFWLGKYEVTQRQWRSVMGNNPSRFKGDDRPVETVSWDDCQKFIQKVNARLKCGARLPTEAEWEYACRAGTTMIKCRGKYIVAGSGVRGWACTDSYYTVADHPLGPYSSPRLLNPKGNLTWGSQIPNFFTDGKTVYALCDRMFIGDDGRRVKDLEASSYHILPLQLDPATGEARLLFGELSP